MKERDIVAEINAENEKKWGKIKECCGQYPPFCRCYLMEEQKNIMTKMVRFPNCNYANAIEIDMREFKPDKEYDHEIFGYYKDMYISIEK